MRITIDIKDTKASALINFLKSLDFVKIYSHEDYDEPSKKEILESINLAVREVEMHSKGKTELSSARDFLNEL